MENIILGFENFDMPSETNKNNLKLEYEKINKELIKIDDMLSNNSFISKAPKEVILNAKNKHKRLLDKKMRLEIS